MRVAEPTEQETFTDYGDPEWIPLGPRLSSFPLHSHEWRCAFLERLVEVGEIAAIEAAARVWDLLEEPKAYRATLVGSAAGVRGKGKLALLNALKAFIEEWLGHHLHVPAIGEFSSMQTWDEHVSRTWANENLREQWVVRKFAAILNGDPIPNAAEFKATRVDALEDSTADAVLRS